MDKQESKDGHEAFDLANFPTRPPSDVHVEQATALTKAGLSTLPVFGSVASELLGAILNPIIMRRRDDWSEELARAVVGLYGKLERLGQEASLENLVARLRHDEAFVTVTTHATVIALRNHQRDKVKALRNAVLHVIAGDAPQEDLQIMYLDLVDSLTPCHLQLLAFLNNPADFGFAEKNETGAPAFPDAKAGEFIASYVPCLKDKPEQYEFYALGLEARDLIDVPGAFFNGKPIVDVLKSISVTWFGKEFLAFIKSPIPD